VWQGFIAQALKDPQLSDFQRQILADYRVTDAEFRAAQDKFATCMENAGWSVTFPPGGGFGVPAGNNPSDIKDPSEDVNRCQSTSLLYVEQVYWGMKDNPQGISSEQQIRDCFSAAGVPDGQGMSDDAFAQMVDDPNFHASTPAGVLCYWDPTGSLGMTIESAEQADASRQTLSGQPSESPS
jgi:hypothetical protein